MAGVWTSDYPAFIEACGRSHDFDFHRNTVCQAFATRTEGDAFLCGARRQWPPLGGTHSIKFCSHAMLHPSEMVALTRKDLVFPRDVGFDIPCLYVHLQNPKTARFARRQHGRIDDVQIIELAERIFGKLPMQCRLYNGSTSLFRKQWDAVMSLLGIPHRQSQRGTTPGTLRGSGAIFFVWPNRGYSMDRLERTMGSPEDPGVLPPRG